MHLSPKVRLREGLGSGIRCGGEAVDLCGGVSGAEAVVDVDHGDAAAAAIEHSEESGEAAEVRAVADAGGNGDDGASDESGDGAGEGALHSGDDDKDGALFEVFADGEQAMDAGDADIGDPFDGVPEEFERDGGFIGDGEIGGACADDADDAAAFWEGLSFDGDASCGGVPDGVGDPFAEDGVMGFGDTAGENDAVFFHDDRGDVADLFGCFAGSENDLREAATTLAVGVYACEADINKAHGRWITVFDQKPTWVSGDGEDGFWWAVVGRGFFGRAEACDAGQDEEWGWCVLRSARCIVYE